MNKKKLAAFLSACLLLLAAAGCSGEPNEEDGYVPSDASLSPYASYADRDDFDDYADDDASAVSLPALATATAPHFSPMPAATATVPAAASQQSAVPDAPPASAGTDAEISASPDAVQPSVPAESAPASVIPTLAPTPTPDPNALTDQRQIADLSYMISTNWGAAEYELQSNYRLEDSAGREIRILIAAVPLEQLNGTGEEAAEQCASMLQISADTITKSRLNDLRGFRVTGYTSDSRDAEGYVIPGSGFCYAVFVTGNSLSSIQSVWTAFLNEVKLPF